MHILFLTHYFPPEVNAPASRTHENARRWVKAGHRVTVITCAPNHPRGELYPGYENRLHQWDELDGIRILRVGTYLTANEGTVKRTLNYLSYLCSSVLFARLVGNVDVVISTSPQFFCGMAGFWVSLLKGVPWILEIRDLWPESIVAVGALRQRSIIRTLEALEAFLYYKADHIVSVTHSFKDHIAGRGVAPEDISVLTNGADLEHFVPAEKENGVRREFGLTGRFVASYIGTHGMAHGLETVLQAADRLRHEEGIVFLLAGDGAERQRLLGMKAQMDLKNVLMLPQQPKAKVPELLAASDVCLVLLKNQALFETVIPSKIFEAMAMARPLVLGVGGESRKIVEGGGCGVCIEPENAQQLAEAVTILAADPTRTETLGRAGRKFVSERYNRDVLAAEYLAVIVSVVRQRQGGS